VKGTELEQTPLCFARARLLSSLSCRTGRPGKRQVSKEIALSHYIQTLKPLATSLNNALYSPTENFPLL